MIGVLHEEYKSIFEYGSGTMQSNHRKIHKYLGITLDYTTVGQVKTTTLDYIYEVLDAFDKADLTGGDTKSINSPDIIFKVEEEFIKLNPKQTVEFHHLAEKYFMLPIGTVWKPAP